MLYIKVLCNISEFRIILYLFYIYFIDVDCFEQINMIPKCIKTINTLYTHETYTKWKGGADDHFRLSGQTSNL